MSPPTTRTLPSDSKVAVKPARAVFNEPVTVNWTVIGDTKELNIHGSHLGPYCYPKTIAAIADGRIDVKPLLATSYPLTSFDEAMQASLSGGVLKNILVPV